jgi:hypothetical protein
MLTSQLAVWVLLKFCLSCNSPATLIPLHLDSAGMSFASSTHKRHWILTKEQLAKMRADVNAKAASKERLGTHLVANHLNVVSWR